jgi:hypothetical protein
VLRQYDFDSLVDFGTELFEGKVGHNPIVAWVNRNSKTHTNIIAVRLVDYCYSHRGEKQSEFFNEKNRYAATSDNFKKIPGSPVAYWVGENIINSFSNTPIGSILTTREGMATADNDRFLRYWFEVVKGNIGFGLSSNNDAEKSSFKWFPYNKGGEFRKWYGNNDFIVNWLNCGSEIRNNVDQKTGRVRSHNYNGEYAFTRGVTWSALSSAKISLRYSEKGFLFDSKGAKAFSSSNNTLCYCMGLINSIVGLTYLDLISPTIDFKVGDIIQIPLMKSGENTETGIVENNVSFSRIDWDSFETSWDFKKHPLL